MVLSKQSSESRRTGMTKQTVDFRNFSNVPNKYKQTNKLLHVPNVWDSLRMDNFRVHSVRRLTTIRYY
jgi:hypothetical protein